MKTRRTQLDEVGDIAAAPGSRTWAIAVREKLAAALHDAEFSSEHARTFRDLMQQHEGWKVLENSRGHRFMSFEAFCCERRPFGLGYSIDHIERVIQEREEAETAQALAASDEITPLAEHGGDQRSSNAKSRLHDNVDSRGASIEYLVRRLKRDAPEIADQLAAGEFKSARSAAVAAGIVKNPTRFDMLASAWKKATTAERKKFLAWIEAFDGTA